MPKGCRAPCLTRCCHADGSTRPRSRTVTTTWTSSAAVARSASAAAAASAAESEKCSWLISTSPSHSRVSSTSRRHDLALGRLELLDDDVHALDQGGGVEVVAQRGARQQQAALRAARRGAATRGPGGTWSRTSRFRSGGTRAGPWFDPIEPLHGRCGQTPPVAWDREFFYDTYPRVEEAFGARLDESLAPRDPSVLLQVVRELDLRPDSRVVDVGCGEGAHAFRLATHFGFRVLGIDPVQRHLDLAREARRAR